MLNPAQPWGITWLGFCIVYGLGLVLVWVLTWWERRPRGWAALPDPLPELSLEQLAYLHGDTRRAAEAVLAKLLADRVLEAGKPPGISEIAAVTAPTVRARRPPPPHLRLTGLYGVAARAATRPVRHENVVLLLECSPKMTSVVDGLRDHGLIGEEKRRALLRRWGPTALMNALIVVLFVRVASAWWAPAAWASLPGPEQVTVVVLTLLGFVAGIWTVRSRSARNANEYAYLTPAGLALVRALRRSRAHPTDNLVAPVAARYEEQLRGPAGVVAARGLAHYPDHEVQDALYRPSEPGAPSRDGHAGS